MMRAPRRPSVERVSAEYNRGFEDGRRGIMRQHGSDAYHLGYDDGLDQYDCDNAEELGYDPSHCA